jgi:hypothetical protein
MMRDIEDIRAGDSTKGEQAEDQQEGDVCPEVPKYHDRWLAEGVLGRCIVKEGMEGGPVVLKVE